jgi:hypothetical protein
MGLYGLDNFLLDGKNSSSIRFLQKAKVMLDELDLDLRRDDHATEEAEKSLFCNAFFYQK